MSRRALLASSLALVAACAQLQPRDGLPPGADAGSAGSASGASGPAHPAAGSPSSEPAAAGVEERPPSPPCPGECCPGSRRWCADAVYDGWGTRWCAPDGSWGPCLEGVITAEGVADRPATPCACRHASFTLDCCEDQEDRDGDGLADCEVPAGHTPPACPRTRELCGYCDGDRDCGAGDLCLIYPDAGGRSLATFCSRACAADAPCPDGFRCFPVTDRGGRVVSSQCVPVVGACPSPPLD